MRVQAKILAALMVLAGPVFGQGGGSASETKAQVAGQGATERPRLRLVFTVRELDSAGKALNTREYQTMIAAQPEAGKTSKAEIRSGAKVPLATSSPVHGESIQFAYHDVGVNFDVGDVQWIAPSRIAMVVTADVSSFEPAAQSNLAATIRNNRWSSDEQMNVGEQKALFSSDDLGSKNRLQVSLAVQRAD